MDERDRLKAELSALDTQPDVPGIQSGEYDEVAIYGAGYNHGYQDGRRSAKWGSLGMGFLLGTALMWALSYVLPFLR